MSPCRFLMRRAPLRELNEKTCHFAFFPNGYRRPLSVPISKTLSDFSPSNTAAPLSNLWDGMGGRGVCGVRRSATKILRALIELVGRWRAKCSWRNNILIRPEPVIVGVFVINGKTGGPRCLSAFRVMTDHRGKHGRRWPPRGASLWASKKKIIADAIGPTLAATRYSFCRLGHYRRQTYGNQYHLSRPA